MNLRALLFGPTGTGSTAGDFGLLLLRLAAGLALAFGHGIGKMPPPERFIEGVEKLGIPAPTVFAWAAGFSEFLGGLLLAVGLLTRPAAFFILVTMSVAFFVQHANDPFGVKERAMLYGSVALAFVFIGSGRFGLDAMAGGRKG